MQLTFLAIARDELAEVKRFYNRQQQGLGDAFKREAEAAAKLILERPLAWQVEISPREDSCSTSSLTKWSIWFVPSKSS